MGPTFPATRRRLLAHVLPLPGVLALSSLLLACSADARGEPPPDARLDGRLMQVQVVDRDTGQPLTVWRDHGRPVVAGRPGARYALRLTNTSGQRVLAVVAIDGVNVITGETARPDQRGYVFDPGQRYDITGWRKSDRDVAPFEFTALADSYAARTGRPLDVGVIGVAVFRERPAEVAAMDVRPVAGPVAPAAPPAEATAPAATKALPADPARVEITGSSVRRRDTAPAAPAPAPRADAGTAEDADTARAAGTPASRSERLGTGHGARETSVVSWVDFERLTSSPEQLVRIRYDSWDNLVAAGVIPRSVARAPQPEPRAFPADPDAAFVPDPPRR